MLAELKIMDHKSLAAQYKSQVQAVLDAFEARILAVVNDPVAVEGNRPVDQIVLLEFETVDHAKRFYNSPQYQEILHHRLTSATTDLFIFEGSAPGAKMVR